MLSASFLDWWFAPWSYGSSPHASQNADLVGRRDAYRLWCAKAGVKPTLPQVFDPAWHAVALNDGYLLTASARLFGGLHAARQQQREGLAQLGLADRKWCMSIASIQPLASLSTTSITPDEMLEVRGLTELSCRLERAFPGMWSRLKLLLPRELDKQVSALLEHGRDENRLHDADDASDDRASQRALKCWRMCRQRVSEMNHASTPIPTNDVSET